MISEDFYKAAFDAVANAQASGLPVVVLPLVRQQDDENIIERVEVFSATNSTYEGNGMILDVARRINSGAFSYTDEELEGESEF